MGLPVPAGAGVGYVCVLERIQALEASFGALELWGYRQRFLL
jgi:hypothetical protein